MALNLSTLTSSATSGDVLAEALTTADFLENVPVLRNLARGSQKGGDAKQDVALNQPKALPLIKNPAGDLGGYLYIPDVAGNYATGPSVTIGSNETWEGEVDMVITEWGDHLVPMGGGTWSAGFGLVFYTNGLVRLFSKGFPPTTQQPSGVTLGTPFNAKYGFDGTNIYVDIDDTRVYTGTAPSQTSSITHNLELNQQAGIGNVGNYAIQKAKLTVNSSVVFDCDFNGSTSIRHGDTKFKCATGQVVTINQSGNDPATVIKKSVLRFDGVNDFMNGLLNQTVTGGYLFAAFSVLGDGGEGYSHILDATSTGQDSGGLGSFTFFRGPSSANNIRVKYNNNGSVIIHQDVFDSSLGDIMLEGKMEDGSQISKVNNANADNGTTTFSGVLNAEEFVIAADNLDNANPAIDLEFLALFPASITDAQADDVRKYINNRNNVFSLIDSQGYYFFDPQALTDGDLNSTTKKLTGLWNGRIVGSDNGDTSFIASQGTGDDQPTSDKYTLNFADNTDHLTITNPNQAGWQVVGTSLGTFAYRVDNDAVTELNLLGNLGSASYRQAGDLYGIILLPESATGKDIEDARKLLIDRGAADGALAASYYTAWHSRNDIVEFKSANTSSLTNCGYAWSGCSNLGSFPSLDLSSSNNFVSTWQGCSSMSNFGPTEMSNGTNFSSAWHSCSALTTFPAGAKLGTSATGSVNFTAAFQSSGLTSFNTPLPTATNVYLAWYGCTALTSFSSELPSVTYAGYAWTGCSSLTSFSTELPLSNRFVVAWQSCSSLTDFSADVFANWNPSSITSGVFDNTWDGCTALTAQSVENILTSIDASGKYATSDGDAYVNGVNTQLGDAGIDIDYDGTTLSAATNSAVTSLKAKGWVIVVNGVTL